MKEKDNTFRLIKIAKELSVGTSTIVDFLHSKGYEIESNPNSKITQDQYNLLLKEYGHDRNLKKESQNIAFVKRNEKKEVSSNEETDNEDVSENVILVKDTNATSKNDVKTDIKIIGKINLDKFNKFANKNSPEYKKNENKTEFKNEYKNEKIVDKNITDKRIEKTHYKEPFKKEVKIEEKIEIKNTKIEEVIEKKEFLEKKEIIEKKEPIIENEEKIKEIESDIKVVGRIDLSMLNQKTRPPKKTRKQKEDERKEREKQRKDAFEKRKQDLKEEGKLQEVFETDDIVYDREDNINVEEDIFQTSFTKLEGPVVIGKIDLPSDKNKIKEIDKIKKIARKIVPVVAADDKFKGKKRKRKRINKELVDIEAVDPEKKKVAIIKKPILKSKVATKVNPKLKKKKPKTEIDEKDIQKQVKETLARLTNKTKSKSAKYRREKRDDVRTKIEKEREDQVLSEKILQVTEYVTANELANMMGVHVNQIISTCMDLDIPVSINQRLDEETIGMLADEYGFKVEFLAEKYEDDNDDVIEDTEEQLLPRPPIVTVMGHVDHGKTSLLDYIRKTNVIAGEAGGITQHIGAYNVTLAGGQKITFLDTPGHEAFTAMRARGAKITDIAIIVVAADDSVMPQTIEAINHAQAANVPIVFAINKVDKPGANAEKIKEALANMNLLVEDWGGKYGSADISAKQGINVDKLLERVLLEAEMLELKANPDRNAKGTIVEASLDKGKGYVSTILVQNGTLKSGDFVLAGQYFGKVKAMYNERNYKMFEAGPSAPALILGLNGAPEAGDTFVVVDNEREAKEKANYRQQIQREMSLRAQKHLTLDEIGRRIAVGEFKEVNLIIKGDVVGSIEALSDSLIKLSTNEIQVNVRHKAVGQISESDVMLASASKCVIIGFQVRPSVAARKLAEKEDIEIRHYSIIYDAINDLKDAMEGMLSPEIREEILGTAEVTEVFKITKVGTVAGCIVKDGKLSREHKVRIIRDGIVIYTGHLGSLKRFKDDAKEVAKGFECGLNIDKFNDLKQGDMVESFNMKEYKKHL